ncbi:type IV secretory system conjugative DNA transfer family protein, partial [Solilutibacter pythonis]|uniref:type IV secretory system conjugative DNA transfer family protein n=1 Tax=Solilutibacter pythonis TaxID=2483112 RepID=UPI001B8794B9
IGVDIPVDTKTWWTYFQALDTPRMQPYAAKVKWAGYIGFGVPLLLWLMLLVPALKPGKKGIHGDARFAKGGDVAKEGFFDKKQENGIVIGRFGGKLMRLPGQQFVILAAPTRSGKGVGVVIPNLLDYGESMVVLDIKQENFNLTSGWRASQGQAVYLFNPFAEDRRTHRWNPLSYVSRDAAFRISDIQSIAAMLYPDGADEQKFWVSQARNAFTAFALYLFENHDQEVELGLPEDYVNFPTLGRIYRLSSGDGSDLKEYFRGLAGRSFLSAHCRTAFANLLSQADETFASILGTFKEPLNAWINPVLDAATNANDFWLTDVRRKKMTIYIGIQPNKLAEARLIVNLFFSQLINVNTKELPQDNKALKHQCLLLMDEFTSIGKVQIIANAVSYMAGYNIRLLPIIQSMAQLDSTYGREISRTIITNHALQIVYAPREQQDANDYSEMLGYTTIHRRNRSRSHGQQGSVTFSESEERRALMLPQELKAMGNDKEIVLYEGLAHPVKAEKIRYYQDKYFTKRLLAKVEVKPLEIEEGGKPMKKEIKTVVSAVALTGLVACAPVTQVMPGEDRAGSPEVAGRAAVTSPGLSEEARAPALPPPAPKPAPLPPTQPATPEPSAAILAARQQNGRLSAAAL